MGNERSHYIRIFNSDIFLINLKNINCGYAAIFFCGENGTGCVAVKISSRFRLEITIEKV